MIEQYNVVIERGEFLISLEHIWTITYPKQINIDASLNQIKQTCGLAITISYTHSAVVNVYGVCEWALRVIWFFRVVKEPARWLQVGEMVCIILQTIEQTKVFLIICNNTKFLKV